MNRATGWAIFAWLLIVIGCVSIIYRTQFNADLSAFLPRTPTPAQQLLVDQLREGVVSRLILVGIEGDKPEALAKLSKKMAGTLRNDTRFGMVGNGEDVGLTKDREFLWRYRYLLSPAMTPEHFSVAGLHDALQDDLQLLASPAGALVRRILPSDPSGELIRLIDGLEGQAKPSMKEGVWFSKDGQRALMVVQTQATGADIDGQQAALQSLRQAFEQARDNTEVRLLVSGPGVFAVNARATVEGDATRFSLIAIGLITAMLLLLYRSPRVLLLGLVPVATGALAGIAAVSTGFGSVHGITLGFGVTLIGECVDYAIYLFTQTTAGTTPRQTLQRMWPTLRLGVLTSICGFSAMLFSGFQGLAQLGLFSITGLVAAVMVTRWVLPGLLPQGFTAQAAIDIAPKIMEAVRYAPKLRYPLFLVVALAVLYLYQHRTNLWSDDLASLSPVPKSEQLLDEQLRRDIGAPDVRHLIVVRGKSEDAVLSVSENVADVLDGLVQKGTLQGFDSPSTYLPSVQTQRARQNAIPSQAVLRENMRQATDELPFKEDLFEPFFNEISAAKTQPPIDRAALRGTGLGLKLDSLLLNRPNGSVAMLPLRGVSDTAIVVKAIKGLPNVVLLDVKAESDVLYRTYRQEAVGDSLWGALAIVALLIWSLPSYRRVFEVLAPLAAAVAITGAILVMSVQQLSIFHLIGLLLVVAIGSNYALFFDTPPSAEEDRARTIVSLLFANVATMIGFGLLSFSSVPVLNAIGFTVGVGTVLSLVFSAVLINRGDVPTVNKDASKKRRT